MDGCGGRAYTKLLSSERPVPMASLSKNAVIHAPPDPVFAYVSDPSKFPEWLPSMVEVRNVLGAGAGQQYEWTYKMAGMLLRGQSTVVEYTPNQRVVLQSIGSIGSDWTFTVEPHEAGALLRIEVEYSVPVPVLGRLAERLALSRDAREFAVGFDNLKEALEG
ncbi:MAG: SRPBCC family protein [Deltaproteobacteria bacterium]|nr:MAG: SRPBCC family protein [Deltaproteobacteria bacterium]